MQCIILRDSSKVGEDGEPKSRGCGFVEFDNHEHALVCLRQMNNNPKLFGGPQKRPIVEFAVENVRVLKVRERRQRQTAEKQFNRSLAEGKTIYRWPVLRIST
jgi:nucleolar protein 4